MAEFIEGFVTDCQVRGLTPHVIETYRSQLKVFLRAYPEPAKANLDELRDFLASLRDRGLAGSTLEGYFAAISAFYDYLVFEGKAAGNPVPLFRKRYLREKVQHNGENTRQLITIQEMRRLIRAASDIRDKAILLTLAKTGMRRGELLSLKIDDIELKEMIIRIPAKAKRSNRLAFIDPELKDILEQYLTWRSSRAKTQWLWITKAGGRIHKDYPGEVLADLGAALRLHTKEGPLCQRLTPHCLRHFLTTHLFRAGMNPEYIKWIRGDSLESEAWQIYNHIDIEEVRKEYLRCIPKLTIKP